MLVEKNLVITGMHHYKQSKHNVAIVVIVEMHLVSRIISSWSDDIRGTIFLKAMP